MDFNIDDLINKYLDPIKSGVENGEIGIPAVEEKQTEEIGSAFPESDEKEVKIYDTAVVPEECVEPYKAVVEEDTSVDNDEPENISDFLKDIFGSSAFPEAEKTNIGEDIPDVSENDMSGKPADIPEATGDHLSISNAGENDVIDYYDSFPMRKNAQNADEKTDGISDDKDDGIPTENAEIKTVTGEVKIPPVYKTFEPEKYAVEKPDRDLSTDENYFRKSPPKYHSKPEGFEKFADMPELHDSEENSFRSEVRKDMTDEDYEEIFRKQEMPSPVTSRAALANDLLSHLDSEEEKPEEKKPISDLKRGSDLIDRTAIMENLFSNFAKVEQAAESDAEAVEKEDPIHTENEHTVIFSSDPIPSHMTEPAERAGIAAEKNQVRVFRTGELQPLHEFSGSGTRTRVSITDDFPMKEEIAEPLEGQMSFFEFPEQEPEDQIDEDTVEQDVRYRRLEKVKNFRLTKEFEDMDTENSSMYDRPEETAGDNDTGGEKYLGNIPEYVVESDRRKISWFLLKERRRKNISTAILVLITFCFALLEVLPRISGKIKEAIGPGSFPNSIVSFILVMLAAIASVDNVVSGMDSIFIKRRPDGRSLGLIALIMAIIQSIVAMFYPTDGKTGLLAGSVAFILLINSITAGMEHDRVMRNFKFCAYTGKKSLSSIVTVSGDQERREIGQALAMNDPVVKYSCKINFPRRFIELSSTNKITERHGMALIVLTCAMGVILSIVCGFREGPYYALSGITAAFCAAIPIAEYFAVTNELKRSCGALNESGGMISSLKAAQKCSETDAVLIDAAELIDREGCEMHGMKDFKNVRLDDILLYTAALVVKSDGPLTEVFRSVVADTDDVLPAVSSISFEENLGISGWIHGQKVLLGNRNLMAAHNISVPTHREEATYCVDDRKVLYVAIADKLAAMFVVSYAVDMSKAAYLHCLERNNITVLIDSCDPNVSEELLEAGFGLEYDSIKIISSIAGRIFRRLKNNFFKKADATVIHDGNSKSLLMGIASAVSLRNAAKIISIAQLVAAVLSLLIMVVLAAASHFVFINSWFIAIVDIISIALFMLAGRFFRV
ncbi:MAG: hypothetical protein K5756_00075 [Clostridiales bacterium]|nr:hypothetical protein [Clostridiales bacterium]